MSTIPFGLLSLASLLCPLLSLCQPQRLNLNRPGEYRFDYFQVPGAVVTNPSSINDSLTVTGTYSSEDGVTGGFVRTVCGLLTTFHVGQVYTGELQMNAVGEIAGVYQDVSGESRGFIRSADGSITKFNPGAPGGVTDVRGINDRGAVIGIYSTTNKANPSQAYVRTRDGAFTRFAIPGSTFVFPRGISDLGEVTGSYFYDGGTQVGGFVRSPGGIITTFTYAAGIVPLAINWAGTITGWYAPPIGSFQGFLRRPDGTIVSFSMPEMGEINTELMGLNEGGFITGSYTTVGTAPPGSRPEENMHGFIRSPEGVISNFEVPGAYSTTAVAINDFNVVAGWSDSETNPGAFIRILDIL